MKKKVIDTWKACNLQGWWLKMAPENTVHILLLLKKKKALYWKGKWPRWTWCHVTSLFFKPPSQQFPRLMNQIASSDLCLTVAVACRVINHRYRAAVDPHANAHCAISPPPRNSRITSACVRTQRYTKHVPQHVLSFPPERQISNNKALFAIFPQPS